MFTTTSLKTQSISSPNNYFSHTPKFLVKLFFLITLVLNFVRAQSVSRQVMGSMLQNLPFDKNLPQVCREMLVDYENGPLAAIYTSCGKRELIRFYIKTTNTIAKSNEMYAICNDECNKEIEVFARVLEPVCGDAKIFAEPLSADDKNIFRTILGTMSAKQISDFFMNFHEFSCLKTNDGVPCLKTYLTNSDRKKMSNYRSKASSTDKSTIYDDDYDEQDDDITSVLHKFRNSSLQGLEDTYCNYCTSSQIKKSKDLIRYPLFQGKRSGFENVENFLSESCTSQSLEDQTTMKPSIDAKKNDASSSKGPLWLKTSMFIINLVMLISIVL